MHKTNYKLLDELDWLYDRIKFFKNNGYEKEKFFKETIEKYYEAFLNWTYILIKDNGYKSKYMNKYFEQCKEVFELYKNISYNSKINLVLKLKWAFFYLKGFKRVIYKVKNVIEQKIKEKNFKSRYNQYLKNIGRTEKYLIFNAPDHGNIGDHAILFAEEEFIKDKGHKSFAIVSNEIDLFIKNFSDTVKKDDFILITGGGNLGTLWEHEQNNVNKVIEKYSNNKIIVFPQTVYYSNDYHGKYRLEKDKAIYKSCSNLTFVCRDSKSFDLMKNVFKINALQTSDIVTYLNYSKEKNLDRKNILFCLRKDKEKVSNEDDIKKIIQYFNEKLPNEKIIFVDTVFPGKFSLNKGKKYLMKFLNKTKKSKIFVTDRLHGMIFATITGTPCIAMANSSGKVKGVHKWISQNNDFVKFVENFEDFEKQIKEFDFEKNNIYNNEEIRKNFNRIPIGEKNG